MIKTSHYFLLFLFFSSVVFSQTVNISGRVISKTDVENIHVINKTAKVFTVTNIKGVFNITAKVNDTLQFSSIQHGVKSITVSKGTIVSKTMIVNLDEQINELEEVVVGKVLTGDLLSDIENADQNAPINFYDVGIPGYTGKIATQSERRLSEAGQFKPQMLLGLLGGGVPLNPILNGISGRTKMLKERVRIEKKKDLIRRIKNDFSVDFFENHHLEEDLRTDFFYFCEEDPNFEKRCVGKSDLEIYFYLQERLIKYKENQQSKKD